MRGVSRRHKTLDDLFFLVGGWVRLLLWNVYRMR